MTDTLRIEYTPLSALKRHPRNPKDHDNGAIAKSINRFGYVTPIIMDERSGYIVAGHGRIDTLADMQAKGEAAPARIQVGDNGEWLVPVQRGVTFNSDSEVEAYLVADNRLTELGGWHDAELAGLLQDLANEDTALLEATGYDGDDLDNLLYRLNPTFDPMQEWQGMPEFENEEVKPFKSLTLHFKTEQDMNDFAALVGQTVTLVTKFLYYPAQAQRDNTKFRVISDEQP